MFELVMRTGNGYQFPPFSFKSLHDFPAGHLCIMHTNTHSVNSNRCYLIRWMILVKLFPLAVIKAEM